MEHTEIKGLSSRGLIPYKILDMLGDGPNTYRVIARRIREDLPLGSVPIESHVHGALQRFLRKGWIERLAEIPAGFNPRSKPVQLTELGIQVFRDERIRRGLARSIS